MRAIGLVPLLLPVCLASVSAARQDQSPRPAVPVEPIAAILDAFQSHPIVALGEGPHGNEQGHAFRLSLIRDARFPTTVNDIVVELGNAGYQDVMDRFVRGDEVADAELRQVWQNTTQAGTVADMPIYEDFFRAVRLRNAPLPRDRQLRVLLADPPIDWDRVKAPADIPRDRDGYAATLIQNEVVKKNRRALVIYGDGHFQGRSERPPRSLVARLDASGVKTFIISNSFADLASIQPEVASWRVPSLAFIRGTPIGLRGYDFFYGALPPGDYWLTQRMQDQFDAVLYLGPPSSVTMSRLPPALCADERYLEMRLHRLAVAGSQRQIDALKQYCGAVLKK